MFLVLLGNQTKMKMLSGKTLPGLSFVLYYIYEGVRAIPTYRVYTVSGLRERKITGLQQSKKMHQRLLNKGCLTSSIVKVLRRTIPWH